MARRGVAIGHDPRCPPGRFDAARNDPSYPDRLSLPLSLPTRGEQGHADLSAIGSLLANRARCRILLALADGRALPASELASEAGVAASTASSHLGRLVDAGSVTVAARGRYRYYRLAGPR